MFYQTKEIIFDNRTFIIKFRPDWGGRMCECKLYELVRPTWKIFRTKHLDNIWFMVEDYDSIEVGLKWTVINYWKREASQDMIRKKWDNI